MILKISSYLPEKTLSNEELVRDIEGWTPEQVFQKTGIRSRHVAARGETALDLAELVVERCSAARRRMRIFSFIAPRLATTNFRPRAASSGACPAARHVLRPRHQSGLLRIHIRSCGWRESVAERIATQVLLVNSDTYTHYIHSKDTVCRPILAMARPPRCSDRLPVVASWVSNSVPMAVTQ